MKKLLLFSFILLGIVILNACKKKNEDPPKDDTNGKTKAQLLTQKNWKIAALMSGSSDIWSNPILVPACNKDNEYRFRTDDSLAQYEKTNKCNSSDPDSVVSSYKLYNNTHLIINLRLTSSTTLNDTAEITELNESTLKLNTEYSGFPASITFNHP